MALRRAPTPARRWDGTLLVLTGALCLLGVVLIASATAAQPQLHNLPLRQLAWIGLGFSVLALTASLDHQGVVELGQAFYVGACLTLAVVLLFAKRTAFGGGSWLNLGLFYVQPAELSKLAFILGLTRWLDAHRGELKSFRGLLVPLGMAAFLMVLILRQPDLGTAMVLVPVTLAMLYVAGARLSHLLLLGGLGVAGLPVAWSLLKEYQKNRILTFLNPEMDALGAGYNAIQSQIAVGSGGWTGQGYMRGTQSQLHFVPFHHNDFIFSVLGEEWGLLGSLVLLLLLLGLFARVTDTAMRARSLSGALLCTGLLAWLGTQSFVNIGMTLGVVPVTGIPLPLVSYGGSSLISVMAGLGLVLSVRRDSLGA
jgi:rod shape determining protein RodA